MLEYIKVNPGAFAAAIITSISVTSATSTNIESNIVSSSTIETIVLQQKTAEEAEEQEWDMILSSPHGQRVLYRLLREAREQIATGEFEEGGFGLE